MLKIAQGQCRDSLTVRRVLFIAAYSGQLATCSYNASIG